MAGVENFLGFCFLAGGPEHSAQPPLTPRPMANSAAVPRIRFMFTASTVYYGLVAVKTYIKFEDFRKERLGELSELQAEIARLQAAK